MDTALTAENIHLRFKALKSIKLASPSKDSYRKPKEVYALRGVSFEMSKGQCMGLIGKNGSGKSTLLRVIAGVFKPNEGSVNLHGNTVSLLALGIGFQKELSGRDNIYLSGLLLGFSKKEIETKINDIIEFSELGDAIYRPVNTYSSGMRSKLAFAIASQLNVDVLLIDEAFAVGDIKFKKKSFEKIQEMIANEKCTVIIVSHNMQSIRKLCNRVIWLEDGRIVMDGSTEETVTAYEKHMVAGKNEEN